MEVLDKDDDFDPYLLYGFGIWSYFRYIQWLILAFLLLSLFHLPFILYYGSFTLYDTYYPESAQTSMGALG